MTIGRRYSFETVGRRLLALVRRGAARHLDVVPVADEVRRGEKLAVTVKSTKSRESGQLEAGIICTETYPSVLPQRKLSRSNYVLADEVAYEQWLPAEPGQTVALEVPVDSPFSYEGENLKFRWRVAVRQRQRGLDAVRSRQIRVLP